MALALLAFTAMSALSLQAQAQPAAPAPHEIPQSLVLEHQETMDRLTVLAQRPGQVGVVAGKALALFKRHTQRETDYILPPLTLLPDLADGHVTPDMRWALVMADRVRADREEIFQEHTEVTDVLNALLVAGQAAHDQEAVDFAQSAATDSLNDIELLEPTVVMIGDVLRARLGESH
jgi:hypothetical protein